MTIHVGHRYRLDDGRIGVCRFKGRTMFGQPAHDWIGLILEVGNGEHNGTVKGRVYFKCRDGQGIMVRPIKIVQDMGADTKDLTKKMINDPKGIKLMQQALKLQQEQSDAAAVKLKPSKNVPNVPQKGLKRTVSKSKSGDWGGWKPPSYMDDVDDHSVDIFGQKLHYSKRLLDKHKGEKADKKLMVNEI